MTTCQKYGRAYTCKTAINAIEQNEYKLIPQFAYSSGLVLSYFSYSKKMKNDIHLNTGTLEGKYIEELSQLLSNTNKPAHGPNVNYLLPLCNISDL